METRNINVRTGAGLPKCSIIACKYWVEQLVSHPRAIIATLAPPVHPTPRCLSSPRRRCYRSELNNEIGMNHSLRGSLFRGITSIALQTAKLLRTRCEETPRDGASFGPTNSHLHFTFSWQRNYAAIIQRFSRRF